MDDGEGQEFTSDAPSGQETATPETQAPDNSQSTEQEANPFWGEVEKLTGPNVYKLIQPHLAKADTAARQRVEAVNQKYAPWQQFEQQGINPQHVQQALGVVQQLNTAPEQVFESLRSFLEREGRMPSQAELKQEVIEDESESDPRDQKIQQLEEQLQQFQGFVTGQFTAQQQQAAAQEADAWLDGEIARLSDPKNGYDQADIQEIVRIAAFQSQSTGKEPDLNIAAQQYNAMRDRIRTAPRPGQTAPRLPVGSGGSPQQQVDVGSLTKDQRRELVANMLQRG